MKFKSLIFFTILFSFTTFLSCNSDKTSSTKKNSKEKGEEASSDLTFRDVNGIRFYEVKRRFKNGLSFNKDGFQQEPSWTIEYKAPDTMFAYSPEKKGMEAFYLQYDHGKVYNFAREFFRVNKIMKDSLVLQRLQVDGKIIAGDDDIRSDVNCTFYTKNYIENVLHSTVIELQKPSKADTAFIKNLSDRTYRDPFNAKVAFAARKPVVFTPLSQSISVERLGNEDLDAHRAEVYDYMYPKYKIVISKCYKAFNYLIGVIVDANGNMYVKDIYYVLNPEGRKKMVQGVVDVYLKNMLKVTPGKTLNIPHSTEITINIIGKLAQ
jgi:hypothetical protein